MANYYGVSRTNYFRVTDEEKYKQLFANLSSEDPISDFTKEQDGVTWHGFGCYSIIGYCSLFCEMDDIGDFYKDLQKILPEDEAFIMIETGYESLHHVTGWATIVTAKEIRSVDIVSEAVEIAKEMLGNPDFSTQCSY